MSRTNERRDAIDDILEQWSEQRPELDTAPLGVVVRVMSLYQAFLGEATDALRPLGLELWGYDVLSALRRQGAPFALPASVLARETGLSPSAMTNRIDRLEAERLVRRGSDTADRRSVIVRLTRRGRRLIDEAIGLRLAAADDSLANLGPRERRQLAGLLRKLVLGQQVF